MAAVGVLDRMMNSLWPHLTNSRQLSANDSRNERNQLAHVRCHPRELAADLRRYFGQGSVFLFIWFFFFRRLLIPTTSQGWQIACCQWERSQNDKILSANSARRYVPRSESNLFRFGCCNIALQMRKKNTSEKDEHFNFLLYARCIGVIFPKWDWLIVSFRSFTLPFGFFSFSLERLRRRLRCRVG